MICSDWCGEKRPYRRGPWIERGTALRSVGVKSRLRGSDTQTQIPTVEVESTGLVALSLMMGSWLISILQAGVGIGGQ